MNILVFNPGSNSLKAGLVACGEKQSSASEGQKLVEVILEGIGKEPKLSVYEGKKIASTTPVPAENFREAAQSILTWLDEQVREEHSDWSLGSVKGVGVRVVHGGGNFTKPTEITEKVGQQIVALGKWAPLHNQHSAEILAPLRSRFAHVPIYAVFDTTFHRTIPLKAALYGIPYELSRKHAIRRYGFHGISHRYLLERYAKIVGKQPSELNLVTTHLESGCSITAIARGQSVDNTMGLTPLEGLMMGTRCGDVDPALIPFLAKAEHLEIEQVMTLLEKQSGLLGVSGKSLDTRVLMRDYDTNSRVQLAMEMFAYRVVKAIGAHLAALGGAHAVIFGGGIAENTPLVRERVCEALRWCGLEMHREQNRLLIDIEGRLSTEDSPIQAYVIPVEETLQIAHECSQVVAAHRAHSAAA
ncbi:MAG TPA: acetate/propionate family kinase [Terracidiphilus sp.]|nr:acetate/propionate family kinase [Terracidiphilus sp.]